MNDKRATLRHCLAGLAYRTQKALRVRLIRLARSRRASRFERLPTWFAT